MSTLDRAHYQLLLALARRGTISAAATELFVTQSAASQRLREAERRLGFPLTIRNGRSVTLTPAALRLVDAAGISERALDTAEADARWLGGSREAALQFAVDVHDDCSWFPALLARLDADPASAGMELVRAPAGTALTMVLDGAADAAVCAGPNLLAPTTHHLFDDPLVAVVGHTHPLARRSAVAADEFVGADYVTYGTTPQEGFENSTFFAPRRVWPRRILRLESITALLGVVAAGTWTSILPRWTVPHDAGVMCIPLEPAPPPIAWSLVTRSLDAQPRLAETASRVAETLRDRAGTAGINQPQ